MEEQIKRKRGRPRKNKLPEEIQNLISETLKKDTVLDKVCTIESNEETSNILSEWDVPIGQEIEYFDASLSYELTGYKPINEHLGLDFNPSWFTEARDTFNRTGHYTEHKNGTKAFSDFWRELYRRCRDGFTVNGYTITGDHYFFLNFYRLENNDPDSLKEAGASRSIIFPNFMEGLYLWFHYLSMAKKLRLNACMMKAREAGYSLIEAAIIAKNYTVNRGSINVCCAFALVLLDKLLDKVWTALSFLDDNTDGGFSKGRVIDTALLKKSGLFKMINGVKTPTGWGSVIQGIVADKPGKLRGDRTDILMFEECFGKGTKVIMSDYSIKNIEDIKIGDFVLGLDGSPQEVMFTTRGIDNLYKIKQKRGIDYVVNSKHKLYLEQRPRVGNQSDLIVLKTVSLYKQLSIYNRRTSYGKFNTAINNKVDLCSIDPYYLGVWLGDGWSESPNRIIVNVVKDIEIYNYIIEYYKSLNLNSKVTKCDNTKQCVRIYGNSNNYTNYLVLLFKSYNLINNKHIPKEVYFSTLEYKLQVLAGLIDTDGSLNRQFTYYFSSSDQKFANQVTLLARSCGFEVKLSIKITKSGYSTNVPQYRLLIKGDLALIPVKVQRKICTNKRFNTTNSTSIEIEDLPIGEYYGITLKSYGKNTDNLFLLEDFTIVHNCGLWPNFLKAYTQADALVGLIGNLFGIRLIGGR